MIAEYVQVPFGTGDPDRDIKTRPEFLNPGRSKIPDANTGNLLFDLPDVWWYIYPGPLPKNQVSFYINKAVG